MAKSLNWRSFLRSTPLLILLGLGGVTTAITVGMPGLTLPTASGGSISDSPKEVIGYEIVESYGGEVRVLDYFDNCSTTRIVKKIQEK